MSHTKKHKHAGDKKSSSISSRGRKKAMWLLIILGVVVMLVYALSFQNAEDSELIEETGTQSEQPLR